MIGQFSWMGASKKNRAERRPWKFETLTLVARRRQHLPVFCMIFWVFLFSLKQGVCPRVDNKQSSHSYSLIDTLVTRTWTLLLARYNRWIPSQWLCLANETVSWGSLVSRIKILCLESFGSGLPGFNFLSLYARTHAHIHTCTNPYTNLHTCMTTFT